MLLWLKRLWDFYTGTEDEPVIEKVFIPISLPDARPHSEKWNDKSYLGEVSSLRGNNIYLTEITEALGGLRNMADLAKNPDELQGYNAGIKVLKDLLTAPARAQEILRRANQEKENDEQLPGNDFSGR